MTTTVQGTGTFSFYWKVSSESGCDYLEFYIDDSLQDRISGSGGGWTQKSYNLTGTGSHTLKWRYAKDGTDSSGSDCGWVDRVQWTGTVGYEGPVPMPTDWDQISYTYDPAGRRIEKKYDTTTVVKYVEACPEPVERDGAHCIAEYDGNNQLLRKYIYGPSGSEKSEARGTKSETNPKHELPMTKTGPPVGPAVWDFGFPSLGVVSNFDIRISNLPAHYYHFDALGSVIALSGADGNTAVLYEYSVYDQVAASDPNHPNRFMFTGREFDRETGLYYYRARYYHPEIGRFLQTDPIGYGDGMNWYRYCRNSPVVLVDHSGRSPTTTPDDGFGTPSAMLWGNGALKMVDDDWTAIDMAATAYACTPVDLLYFRPDFCDVCDALIPPPMVLFDGSLTEDAPNVGGLGTRNMVLNQYVVGGIPLADLSDVELKELLAKEQKAGWAIGSEITASLQSWDIGASAGHGDMYFNVTHDTGQFKFITNGIDPGYALVDIGVSMTGVFAYGWDPAAWTGTFNVLTFNIGVLSVTGFMSPNGSWAGLAFGIDIGPFPVGGAWKELYYTPDEDEDDPRPRQ